MTDKDTTGTSMGSGISRRQFASVAGTAAVGAVAGCLGSDAQTIRVAAWSGTYAENFEEGVVDPFREETDHEVEVIPEWAEMLSRVRSAPEDNPPFDLMSAHGDFLLRGAADDLFAEVDLDNIPNLDTVYPHLRNEFRTEYLEYGVPTDGASYAIVYDESNVDFTPTDWTDFLRDEVDSGALEAGFWTDTISTVAVMTGEAEGANELYDEQYHDALIGVLEELDENHIEAWTAGGAELWENLRQEVVNMGMSYTGSGWVETDDNDDWEIVTPSVTSGYFDHFVRVRGTDEKKEAVEEFMNHMLDPEIQERWYESGNVLLASEEAEYDSRGEETYPTSNDEMETMLSGFPNFQQLQPHYDTLNEQFSEIVYE
ncbi:ABC transporter substrate-binding protein [Natrarchaeobius chitinivorans]|uniref:Extracellular solute-binding protein n=1 Tax=Natrarchaeobius chitinivorans TaxID=1679083 RepID=A0A3N6M890_NATCH|nr:extracellular solute-binding protein [Natrarchaeobius chitinivorans]RQG89656.1 extracellular solute-binding protein [Natrarchaeobius chitinivorans]